MSSPPRRRPGGGGGRLGSPDPHKQQKPLTDETTLFVIDDTKDSDASTANISDNNSSNNKPPLKRLTTATRHKDYHPTSYQDEGTGFTFRAVLVGTLLGCIIGASNMYLGLTVGWSFGGSLFGSIVGFSILKPLSRILPTYFGGGYFGPKENCTVQSAASAAGGLSVGFISAIPALYRIPLRRYFILKQKLVFPSPTVAAETIKSLHDSTAGELAGRRKARVLLIAFIIAFVVKCATWWVPVILEWHILYWVGTVSNSPALVAADLVWKWKLELASAFVGAGMLIGTQTAGSFLGGSITAWAVVGPLLLSYGVVAGSYGYPSNMNPSKPLSDQEFKSQVTAQYWLLWPGVCMMISSSFTELAVRWPSLWRGIKGAIIDGYHSLRATITRTPPTPSPSTTTWPSSLSTRALKGADIGLKTVGKREEEKGLIEAAREEQKEIEVEDEMGDGKKGRGGEEEEEEDPAPLHHQVPIVLSTFFKVGAAEAILAILLGFVLAFVGIQSSGETDINPTGSIGKTSQFVFAAFRHNDINRMLKTNLIAGNVAAACASQTVDMVGDLKTAHLLRASPRSQFLAQAIGSFFAVFLAVGLFTIFGIAYPCFLTPPHLLAAMNTTQTCPFEAPAVASWTAVSVALTSGISRTIPSSSAYTSLVVTILTVLYTTFKHYSPQRYRPYLPSLNAVGIALVNPTPQIGVALVVGALVSETWKRRHRGGWEMFAFAVASGMIAGEGIGGIVEAGYALGGCRGEDVGGVGDSWGCG
ncbi:OPT oligopeptide transporter protein-domain-containing protein [Chytridium lagenaria]|nr:OPT oligopeptide transporter protein-domain-containing protein [Chytridium lagenaria]